MKNQSKLLVIFTIILIAIPFLSAVWWNPFSWFNEDTGETIEYETPYNETIEEPIPEEYNNSENIYDIKGYRFENYRIIQTGEEYQYDVVMEKDIKNGKLKIKVQKDYNAKSTLPKVLILQDEEGNILSSALLEIKGNKYEYNFDYDKPKKKAKIGKNSITIIKISDAEYLNSSRDLIENIYDYVKAEDNITYSATNGNYIRVNFEQQLKNGNDISLYASGSGSIEIYKEGTNDLVGTISGISSYKKYSTLLSNVGERTDTFDLKIIGNVDVDYIVDPTGYFTFQINISSDGQKFGFLTDNAADLLVLWGDGTNNTYSGSATRTHSYSTAGIYNVSLNGQATRIAFYGSSATPTLLRDILTNMSDGLTGITSGNSMFRGCTGITTFAEPAFFDDVSGNVTTMFRMFQSATSFKQDISNWNVSSVTTAINMFLDVTLPTVVYDGILIKWSNQTLKTRVAISFGSSKYTTIGKVGRDILTNAPNSWTITDGGLTEVVTSPIQFVYPTPENNSVLTGIATINVSVVENSLKNFTFNWNNESFEYEPSNDFNNVQLLDFSSEDLGFYSKFDNENYSDFSNSNIIVSCASVGCPVYNSSGKFGGNYYFDDGNSFVLEDTDTLHFNSHRSYSAWIKTSDNDALVVGKSSYTSGANQDLALRTNVVQVDGDGYNDFTLSFNNNTLDNNWHHVVATYDSDLSSNQVKLYFDGGLDNQGGVSGSGRLLQSAPINYRIGSVYDTELNDFTGFIDEVRIYNKTLSLEEVKELYSSQKLTKVNSTDWNFQTTESQLSEGDYNYFASACDISDSCSSTEERSLTINFPTLNLDLLNPILTSVNVSQNKFFNVSLNVSCVEEDCGNISVYLDPIEGCNPDLESNTYCSDSCYPMFIDSYGEGWNGWSYYSGTSACYNSNDWYMSSFNVYSDDGTTCDNMLGAGEGQCVGVQMEMGQSRYCPSYDRNGGEVTNSDCSSGSDCGMEFWDSESCNSQTGCSWNGDWEYCEGSYPSACSDCDSYFNLSNSFFVGDAFIKGLVNTTVGAIPFYTLTNPINISLNKGQSEVVTFSVNATGNLSSESGLNYTFFAFANLTGNPSISNITSMWNVSIIEGEEDCTEFLMNTSWSEWSNIGSCLITDQQNQSRFLTQYDNNTCGTYENQTFYEYQLVECNYCSYSLTNTSWSDWINTTCSLDQMNQSRFLVEYDSNKESCYDITNLESDLYENVTYYEYQLVGPTYQNTSWNEWDTGICQINNLNQTRNLTSYDLFGCGENITYFEHNFTEAILLNTTKSEWSNVGECLITDQQNQSRSWIQYDSLNLGCYSNQTFYEYQLVECNYCSYSVVNTSWSDWENYQCSENEMQQIRNLTEYDENYNSCYLITELESDLWNNGNNNTHFEYQLIGNNWMNTSWSEWDEGVCIINNLNQTRNLTQYDEYGCGLNVTFYEYNLTEAILLNTTKSDWSEGVCQVNDLNQSRSWTQYDSLNLGCYENETFVEYNFTEANLTYTDYSDWENLTCSLDQMNQSRFRTQYDSNELGCFENITEYDYQLTGPTYQNTTWSEWQTLECLPTDFYNQTRNLTSYDLFGCGENITYFEYRDNVETCDYCTPVLKNSSKTEWSNIGSCLITDEQNQSRTWVEYDENDCNDFTNVTHTEYQTIPCNYCSYSVVNTSWSSWSNLDCLNITSRNQTSSLTEYDENYSSCYDVTGIESDLWNNGNNNTYYDYRVVDDETCFSCTESLVNTSKSDWENLSCSLTQMNQSRFWIEYDENNCGTFTNVTYYDYQLVGPTYQNSTWTEWENLICLPTDFYNQSRNLTSTDIFGCADNTTYFEYRDDVEVCDYCVVNLTNTSWYEWINDGVCLPDDNQQQVSNLTQYDSNDCGEVENQTFYQYQNISCDFCTPNRVNTSWSDWSEGVCQVNDLNQSREITEYDENTCYDITGLESDLSINITFYEYNLTEANLTYTDYSDWENTTCSLDQMNQSRNRIQYDSNDLGCFLNVTEYDYQLVGPVYVNSSWTPWIDLECLSTDFYNQSRNFTSSDIYGCANTLTFFEYRDDEDVCDFCTPNLVNSSKTSWVDTTSCIDELVNQSRNWTQYDYNDCGEVANETFFEYRTTSCGGTVLTAPTISLLNCRIPNTNPLCWFYYFGIGLLQKNIILINGGILNII